MYTELEAAAAAVVTMIGNRKVVGDVRDAVSYCRN